MRLCRWYLFLRPCRLCRWAGFLRRVLDLKKRRPRPLMFLKLSFVPILNYGSAELGGHQLLFGRCDELLPSILLLSDLLIHFKCRLVAPCPGLCCTLLCSCNLLCALRYKLLFLSPNGQGKSGFVFFNPTLSGFRCSL